MTIQTADREGAKLSGIRKVIAQRMVDSLATAAQLTYFADADITGLMQMRRDWKAAGRKIGVEDCVIHALVNTLCDFPEFNALLDEDRFSISRVVDVSVAISSKLGLMTPVVGGAEKLSLEQIAAARRDLVSRALAGQLKVSDMKGGTITISNLGLTRVRHFTPILNSPQVILLGLGKISHVAFPGEEGSVSWRQVMGLSLTADHRVLDGEPCGRFLSALCERLENFSATA